MAITITDSPRPLAILNEKLMYVCTSTNVANTGFRYQFEVTIGGDTLTFLVPPNPNNRGVFDVREAIRGYFRPLLAPQGGTGQDSIHDLGVNQSVLHAYEDAASSTWIRSVSVTIKEGWIISGVFTPTTSGQATDSFVCLPARPDLFYGYFPLYRKDHSNMFDVRFLSELDGRMYSNKWPERWKYGFDPSSYTIIPVRSWHRGIVTYFADNGTLLATNNGAKIRMQLLDATNTTHTADYTITSNGTGRLMHFGGYPYNLDNTNYATLLKPGNFPGWKYYTLTVLDSNDDPFGGFFVFFPEAEYGGGDVIECATGDGIIRATWLNAFGGWDYFSFNMQYVERMEFTRTRTRRPLGTYGSTTFDITQYDRGLEELDNEGQFLITASSELITKHEFDFLSGMFRSRQVFIQSSYPVYNAFGARSILPVVIDQSDYTFQKTNFTELKRLDVTFRSAIPTW